MSFGPVERMKINNAVEKVLSIPGSKGQGVLEMAMVFDANLSKDVAQIISKGICDSLKSHSRLFQNVRLNTIRWIANDHFIKEISAMPLIQMGRYFENYEQSIAKKNLELLASQLKLFYARSKVIIFLTNGDYRVGDEKKLIEQLQPFLFRRLIIIECKQQTDESSQFVVRQGMELMNLGKAMELL